MILSCGSHFRLMVMKKVLMVRDIHDIVLHVGYAIVSCQRSHTCN